MGQSLKLEGSLSDKVAAAPLDPGVYLMKDAKGKILYVGKAKNLKNRVRTYFHASQKSPRIEYLVRKIEDIEYLLTGNEVEALILENHWIKKIRPQYNIALKDDKTYPYIKIDKKHDFPRAYLSRRPSKGDGAQYFGPFPNSTAVHTAIRLASKVFKLRDCKDHEFANRSRPCLSYQMNFCTAPCVDYVDKETYAKQVSEYEVFVAGNSQALEDKWLDKMTESSDKQEYEIAAELRDRIQAIQSIHKQNDQRIEDIKDFVDRDIWGLWPETIDDDTHFVDVVILQFRKGKWMGQQHRIVDLQDRVEDQADFFTHILLQHYAKYSLPEEILHATDAIASDDKNKLISALKEVAPEQKEKSEESTLHLFPYDDKKDWARLGEMATQNAKSLSESLEVRRQSVLSGVEDLQKELKLNVLPKHIECIDISHFQGASTVASCVVFKNGEADKSSYRKYNVNSVGDKPDDFQSMKEIVSRRYVVSDKHELPDLLVVDGGKGQLGAVCEILKEFKVDLKVIGLAKARTEQDFSSENVESSKERIFLPGRKNPKVIRNPHVFKLLTQMRDEAHRFAISFHRKKRDKI